MNFRNSEIFLAKAEKFRYTTNCCGMIAVKREVAACRQVFPWSECQESRKALRI